MNMFLFRLTIIGVFMVVEFAFIMNFGIMGGFIPFLLLGLTFIGNPRFLLLVFWLWAIFNRTILYAVPRNISIFLDIGLLFVLASTYILKRKKFNNIKPIIITIIGLLTLTFISFLANASPIDGALRFVIAYFRFLVVFLYTRYFFKSSDAKLFYRIMIITLIIQVIPNIGWMLHINPLPNHTLNPADFAIGTFRACNVVAYLCIACICTFSAILLNKEVPTKQRIIARIMLIISICQLWITYTVHANMLVIICLGILVAEKAVSVRIKAVILVATLLPVLLFMQIANQSSSANSTTVNTSGLNSLNYNYLQIRFQRMIEGTKGRVYKEILFYSPQDMPYPLIGAGPGNFGSAMGFNARRPLAVKYITYVLDADTKRRKELAEGESITGAAATGFLAIWSELGPFGFILYWGIHLYALSHILRNLRGKIYTDPYQKVLAEAFVPTMAMWLVLNLLADFCTVRVMHAGIWIWAAIVWDVGNNIIDRNTEIDISTDDKTIQEIAAT